MKKSCLVFLAAVLQILILLSICYADLNTNYSIVQRSSLPVGLVEHVAVYSNFLNKIYVFGGNYGNAVISNKIYIYDVA